jgi:hypothetical protein
MTASQRVKALASGCGSCRFSASGLCADHERYADAVREAEAAAAARQRVADAALVVQLGKNPGFWDSWPERVAAEILAGGGGAGD